MHTDIPNHEPGLLLMTCGNTQPIRPSMGSWLTYGLGTENQNLPGFVVMCPGKPVVGPALWNNSFLPGVFQGCHIQNLDPKRVIDHIQNKNVAAGTQVMPAGDAPLIDRTPARSRASRPPGRC